MIAAYRQNQQLPVIHSQFFPNIFLYDGITPGFFEFQVVYAVGDYFDFAFRNSYFHIFFFNAGGQCHQSVIKRIFCRHKGVNIAIKSVTIRYFRKFLNILPAAAEYAGNFILFEEIDGIGPERKPHCNLPQIELIFFLKLRKFKLQIKFSGFGKTPEKSSGFAGNPDNIIIDGESFRWRRGCGNDKGFMPGGAEGVADIMHAYFRPADIRVKLWYQMRYSHDLYS